MSLEKYVVSVSNLDGIQTRLASIMENGALKRITESQTRLASIMENGALKRITESQTRLASLMENGALKRITESQTRLASLMENGALKRITESQTRLASLMEKSLEGFRAAQEAYNHEELYSEYSSVEVTNDTRDLAKRLSQLEMQNEKLINNVEELTNVINVLNTPSIMKRLCEVFTIISFLFNLYEIITPMLSEVEDVGIGDKENEVIIDESVPSDISDMEQFRDVKFSGGEET